MLPLDDPSPRPGEGLLGSSLRAPRERTPGIRRALKALARAKRRNVDRVAKGQKPIVKGKQVSRIKGLTKTKAKASQKRRRSR
jgi:uncharacterized caspase-like protein